MAATTGAGPRPVPGAPLSLATETMDTAMGAVQGFAPIRKIGRHFCAFHFYAENMGRQVEAHHYCSHLNDEVRQCVIYDSDQPGARLIGVEFIVSERLYGTLPAEEKKMWHSHEYEVKSGILICPELAAVAERPVMQELVTTYGKTWHFWEIDRGDPLPFGVPKLMGAFYKDGQIEDRLIEDVEKRYGLSIKDRREMRADFNGPAVWGDSMQKMFDDGNGYSLSLNECSLGKEPVKEPVKEKGG